MRRKILVIDDSESIYALVRAPLKYDPIDVHHARDGEAGIALSTSLAPDLILLDVDMPGLDGFEVCRRLKSNPATRNVSILFLTSEGSVNQRVRGLTLGAVDYITKPFHPAELRARVCASLRTVHRVSRTAGRGGTDEQTSLWNRQYFDHRLSGCLAEARRYSRPVSVILIDIDHLATLNARYGQAVGDQVIQALAQRLLAQCRGEDIICRFTGGSFAVICPSISRTQAVKFSVRLWQGIASRPIHVGENVINFKCSLGVASFEDSRTGDLLGSAEAALERAKRSGGNHVVAAIQEVSPTTVSQAA